MPSGANTVLASCVMTMLGVDGQIQGVDDIIKIAMTHYR